LWTDLHILLGQARLSLLEPVKSKAPHSNV
jgi:hypothetical protein